MFYFIIWISLGLLANILLFGYDYLFKKYKLVDTTVEDVIFALFLPILGAVYFVITLLFIYADSGIGSKKIKDLFK
jgi:hypothetical protein